MRFLLLQFATLCSAIVLLEATGEPADPHRNLIFVLLDNVGQEWFGCYGSLEQATPNIDRLAEEGVRFEHCYSTPYCSTSRALLLTGRYPYRTGWRFHHDAGIYGGGNFDWEREVTFARILRDAGYATCVSGKWQINNFHEPGQANCLAEHGFDEHLVTPGGKTDSKYWDPLVIENGVWSTRNGAYGPDLYTDFVLDFVERKQNQPFLVYFPITLVHTPLPTTPITKNQVRTPIETFRDNLKYADALIGKIVAKLDQLGIRKNTVLFVSADNGGPPSFPAQTVRGQVQGLMGTFIEPSIDMPMIVHCPGAIEGGRVGALTDYSDILPTLVELGGAKMPDEVKVDGRSYAGWLLGREPAFRREWIHTALNDERLMRDHRFKLYSSGEFYDIASDPNESKDLARSEDPEILAARRRLITALTALPDNSSLGFVPESVASRRYREDKAAGKNTQIRRRRK